MSMMAKTETLERYKVDEFDWICIDEVHRAGSESYQIIMNYFQPDFWLGMTASPERTDGFDIFNLFDHNIAYEIRLQHALKEDLLCPFHYFGITDIEIDGETVDDKTDLRNFSYLVSDTRARYILEQANYFGHSGERVKGLIFCSGKKEAQELSTKFNEYGYYTTVLTGANSEKEREKAINLLTREVSTDEIEKHEKDICNHVKNDTDEMPFLDYIFTIDIFNEGVDIPEINQVLMLRPTESPIVFVQQLGRGLRKAEGKEHVVIIDFIGNYEKNFFIPIALSGNTNFNKDNLRRFVSEGNLIIPGASTIQFDEISKKRIFKAIDLARFNDIKYIKDSYKELKAKIGRIPELEDFEKYGAIDVQRIFQNKSLGSYHEFLKKYEKDYKVTFSNQEEDYLKFISTKLSSGKRVQELETIRLAIEKKANLMNYLKEEMQNTYNITIPDVGYETIQNILTQNFATGTGKDTYKDITIIDEHNNISSNFSKLLVNNEFKRQIIEVIDYAINQYKKEYSERYKDTDLCLYKKYTYEDVCQLLNWEKSLVPLNIGGYKYDEHTNTLPVFINYDKDENISDTIKYTDHFIDSQTLVAMSKSKMKLNSKGMEIFNKAKERNTFIHIFVRKNKDDKVSKEFYYLGQGNIIDIKQETMANDVPVCEILYQLDQPVRQDIYDYIVNN